ncbi:hypothetical protein GALMADRAFT_736809 [Galerina marginata CBS 339.88]|uniref:Uncharacterized protein n=1 Tax=Galerina marginata (strain CBS 339.88) TaxID=685588 RepID=A0A067SPI6_GALM3|nr:hypothetical protein GALMADRAFT_736809 [Galerina marginata CBS 339.88]
MDLTDANALASHIGDRTGKCKLVQLQASANGMGYKGIQTLVNAMEECWTLEKVEMYSNGFMGEHIDSDIIREDLQQFDRLKASNEKDFQIFADDVSKLSSGSGCGHPFLELRLRHILARNVFLKRQVATQALDLLKYSRLALQKSDPSSPFPSKDEEKSSSDDISNPASAMRPFALSKSSSTRHIFTHFPTEIQLAILGHLAPLLSPPQKLRIFKYATDKNTLPRLELCLPDGNMIFLIQIPVLLTVGQTSMSEGINQTVTGIRGLSPTAVQTTRTSALPDESHSLYRSTVHQKQKQKQEWLELVGCESYDPREVI